MGHSRRIDVSCKKLLQQNEGCENEGEDQLPSSTAYCCLVRLLVRLTERPQLLDAVGEVAFLGRHAVQQLREVVHDASDAGLVGCRRARCA